jgi:anaerobic ribonucleoside-triphosphate reductase activating protein
MSDTEPLLNVAHTIPRSAANGPGERFVIWVQGCSIRCPGCWNPDTWSHRRRTIVRPHDLAQTVIASHGIEGLTLTGGEPFEQAEPLLPLVTKVRAAGLSIMAFTGYEPEELDSEAQRALLAMCDILVAGRYRHDQRSLHLAWRGSANQTIHFLTDRYSAATMPDTSQCEIHIAADGSLTMTGFPPAVLTE